MVKLVLLQSVVPKTWDGGWRADGYDTVALLEVETPPNIEKADFAALFEEFVRKVRNGELKVPERAQPAATAKGGKK